MEGFMSQGQPIHWTTKVTLTNEGIEYVPKKFIGRRSPVALPYEFIGHYAEVEAQFAIWHDVAGQAVVEEPKSQKNFYPGLVLFERLMARRTDSLVVADAGESEDDMIGDAEEF